MNRAWAGRAAFAAWILAASPAAAKRLTVEAFHSDLDIRPDGSVHVTETVRARFQGGPFESMTHTVPRRHASAIELLPTGDACTVDRGGRSPRLRWTFAPARDTTRTFVFEYAVRGAVGVEGPVREFEWPLVPAQRQWRINQAGARVGWPEAWQVQQLRARGRPHSQTPTSAAFERRRISDDETFTLKAKFVALEPLAIPAWQQARDIRRRRLQPVAWGAALVLGLGLVSVAAPIVRRAADEKRRLA